MFAGGSVAAVCAVLSVSAGRTRRAGGPGGPGRTGGSPLAPLSAVTPRSGDRVHVGDVFGSHRRRPDTFLLGLLEQFPVLLVQVIQAGLAILDDAAQVVDGGQHPCGATDHEHSGEDAKGPGQDPVHVRAVPRVLDGWNVVVFLHPPNTPVTTSSITPLNRDTAPVNTAMPIVNRRCDA